MNLEAEERRADQIRFLCARLVGAVCANDRLKADKVLAEMRAFVAVACPHLILFELTPPTPKTNPKEPTT